MREMITTALDILGLCLIAAGFGWWLWVEVAPPAGLVTAGVVVTLGSALAATSGRERAPDGVVAARGGER